MSDEQETTQDAIEQAFGNVGDFLKAGDHRFPMNELEDYKVGKNPRKSDKWHIQLTYRTLDGTKSIEVPFDSDTEAYEAVAQLDKLVEAHSKQRY